MGMRVTVSTGNPKIKMPSKREQLKRIAEYRKKHIMWFDKDYFGQKEIFLVTGMIYNGESAKLSVLEKHWADYLGHTATDIESLRLPKVSNKTLSSLTHQNQLLSLQIDGVTNTTDLSFLRELPNLRELKITSLRRNVDLSILTEIKWLRTLVLDFTHPDVDWNSISKLKWLESLDLGDGNMGSTATFRVPNFEFLEALTNLTTLKLHMMRPANKDYSPLTKLANIEELVYHWERGQMPSPEELAPFSAGLAQVAERKASWEKSIAQPGFFDWKPVK